MKTETVRKTKKGRILKHTVTSGMSVGDYYYVVLDENGNHVETIGNRDLTTLNKYMSEL